MKELIKYGRKMAERGLTPSCLGDVSQREGDQMLISVANAGLDELEGHLVLLPIYEPSSQDHLASPELPVHREIYRRTSASVILHGHPPFSIIVSLLYDQKMIVPCDSEGKYPLAEIPVIAGESGSPELAEAAAIALQGHKGVIARGHGSFAIGKTGEEAYKTLSSLEHACQVKYYVEQARDRVSSQQTLWAPWRIDYILTEKPQGCFLCQKAAQNRDEENLILSRGKTNYILLNAYPYNPGHLMVAPYQHKGNLEDLTPEERQEHIEMVAQGVMTLKKAFQPQGFNLGQNLGRVAGAGVEDHLHTHIVPRWGGDTNYMPVLSHAKVLPEALSATYRKIREAFFPQAT